MYQRGDQQRKFEDSCVSGNLQAVVGFSPTVSKIDSNLPSLLFEVLQGAGKDL